MIKYILALVVSGLLFSSAQAEPVFIGTGFFINGSGYLVTAAHVIRDNDHLTVVYKGVEVPATVVSVDNEDDTAILHIDVNNRTWFTLLRHPVDKDNVLILGFPMPEIFGFDLKVSKAVLNTSNDFSDDEQIYGISCPGNSGGPVLDYYGDVVGILVSGYDNPAFEGTPLEGCGTHDQARPLDGIIRQAHDNNVNITVTDYRLFPLDMNQVLTTIVNDDTVVLVVNFPKKEALISPDK